MDISKIQAGESTADPPALAGGAAFLAGRMEIPLFHRLFHGGREMGPRD